MFRKLAQKEETILKSENRILSIDVFRGLSVLLMVFVNSLQPFENAPAWTKHAGDYGLTYVDLVAPFFIFVLALTFKTTYKRRVLKVGKKRTWLRYIRRYLIFLGIGLILTMYAESNLVYFRWGTLQVLGMSGLLLLPTVGLKPYMKVIVAVIFLSIHQTLLFTPLTFPIYDSLEGGILSSFSWGGMMILSSFLAEGLEQEKMYVKRYFLLGGFICLIIGIGSAFFLGISREYISIPYVLISVGISSVLYYFLHYIYDVWGKNTNFIKNERIFSAIGKNAIIFYLIHIVIAYIAFIILPFNILSIAAFAFAISHVIFTWIMAYFLNKREIYIVF